MDIKIKLPTYKTTLPSTKEAVEYRPFTVAEEKIYLIAEETGTPKDKFSALKQIVRNCTDGAINVEKLPLCDTEWLVAKIREKSKGEMLPVRGYCIACENWQDIEFNLSTLEVKNQEKKIEHKIMIADDVGVVLRFPSYDMFVEEKETLTDRTFEVIGKCIECIFQGEEVHDRNDMSENEIRSFLESLPLDAFEKLKGFFDTMPQVMGEVTWKCSCGSENTTEVSGLHNFFG